MRLGVGYLAWLDQQTGYGIGLMKQLIVNADDFGRSEGINRGILEAHRNGIVTSTTVMINFPDAEPAIRQAQAGAPGLGLGLHLNLTAGVPVLPPDQVPSLVTAQGAFHAFETWPEVAGQLDPGDLEAELRAQLDRFVTVAGRAPDHLDAHNHATYLIPPALRVMLAMAAEHGLPLRDAGLNLDNDDNDVVRTLIRGRIAALGASLADDVRAVLDEGPAPLCPARLEVRFFGERATLGDLLVILTTLPDDGVTEIMCHPGYLDGLNPDTSYRGREDELAHLTHRATRELVQAEGIRLVTFADVTAGL